MKKRLFSIILTVILAASAVGMTACKKHTVYDDLAEQGYDVRIIFNAGDAVVNETQDVTIVEVYSSKNTVTTASGKTGIKLLSPDDERRGDAKFKVAMNDNVKNYYPAGWFTTRTPRVDEDGRPLDIYGVPTEESGREQGYVYSGKWDFENDVLDPSTLQNGEMTLYAAWIPFIAYEIYAQNADGEFEYTATHYGIEFEMPVWNTRNGKLKMGDIPKSDGKTFLAAYADEAMKNPYTENINGYEFYDLECGIANTTTVKIYTTWVDGEWLKIFDAEMLVDEMLDDLEDNVDDGKGNVVSGSYIIGDDIDFSEVEWPSELLEAEFAGQIMGDGYSIINLMLPDNQAADSLADMFSAVSDSASIKDLAFAQAEAE